MNNKQQYILTHLVLVECLFFIPTTLLCKILIIQIKKLKKQLPVQQQKNISKTQF